MMKRLALLTVTAAAFLVVVGCEKTTVKGSEGKALTLTAPSNQTIRQTEDNSVKVGITRTKFSDPVTIKFENLPKGVTCTDKDPRIASDSTYANFTLHAAADAPPVDDHAVTVIAEGPEGMRARENFKVTVKSKS
jgi:hypothetical protein